MVINKVSSTEGMENKVSPTEGMVGGGSPPTCPKFAYIPCLLQKLPHPSRLTPTKGSFHPTK